jgi:hypothetical protein
MVTIYAFLLHSYVSAVNENNTDVQNLELLIKYIRDQYICDGRTRNQKDTNTSLQR